MDEVEAGARKDTTLPLLVSASGMPIKIRSIADLGAADNATTFALAPSGALNATLNSSALLDGDAERQSLSFDIGFSPPSPGRFSRLFKIETCAEDGGATRIESAYLTLFGVGKGAPPPLDFTFSDPSAFRGVMLPNAIAPAAGSSFAGIWGGVGIQAGYALTDNILLTAFGLPPLPADSAASATRLMGGFGAGVKFGVPLSDKLWLAAGYQFARVEFARGALSPENYNRSLELHLPYLAASYGNGEARVSLLGGYIDRLQALSRPTFAAQELGVALSGDYRFAERWKVAAEAVFTPALGAIPLTLTARYLDPVFTAELGAAFLGFSPHSAASPLGLSIPILPVVNFIVRW
jgi:hypothetical protein